MATNFTKLKYRWVGETEVFNGTEDKDRESKAELRNEYERCRTVIGSNAEITLSS